MDGVLCGNSKIGDFKRANEGAVKFFETIISGNLMIGARPNIESCQPAAGCKARFALLFWETSAALRRFLLADCKRLGPELLKLPASLLVKFIFSVVFI